MCSFLFLFYSSLSLFVSHFFPPMYIFIYFIFQIQHLLFMCFIYGFWFLIYHGVCICWLLYVCLVCMAEQLCVYVVSRVVHWKLQMLIFNLSLYIPRVSYHTPRILSLSIFFRLCLIHFVSFHFCFVCIVIKRIEVNDGNGDNAIPLNYILPSFPLLRAFFSIHIYNFSLSTSLCFGNWPD